jgi:threonine aldolase
MQSPVDLRSDTVTRPTLAMKDAMMSAPLGDDVFGDDPTVNALQERAAELLGKQRALFVPSGTMANQLALRAQVRSGDEIIAHAGCHIFNYESGAAASICGAQMRVLQSDDGTLPLEELRAALHLSDDPHFAPTAMVCLEDTHNGCGGVLLPAEHAQQVAEVIRPHGIPLHLDGARLCNASAASGRSLRDLAAPFDTVSLCLSMGLGAPLGSVLAGSAETIARAYRFRKMFGGGMRQAGIVAAAGLHALEHHRDGLVQDHRRARAFAEMLDEHPAYEVSVDSVQTNLVYFGLSPAHALGADGGIALVDALAERGVLITGGVHRLRAAFHLDVGDEGLERAISAFVIVAE